MADSDYNAEIIAEFRANEGRVGGPWEGSAARLIPVFMLTRERRAAHD